MFNMTASQERIAELPRANIKRSVFRKPKRYGTTFSSQYLIPIFMDEALPGDTFNVNLSSVIRMNSPLKYPLIDNLEVRFFFFACPNRLLWNNWKRFMGERDPDPDSSIDYTVPIVTCPAGGFDDLELYDYMGIPPGIDNVDVNNLHGRMYNKVWNEFFRSQDLQDSVTVDLGDGPDTASNYVLLKACKPFDYFTACLPYPVKGGTEIDLPLGTTAPVIGNGMSLGLYDGTTGYGPAVDALNDINASTAHYNVAAGTNVALGASPAQNVALGVVPGTNSGLIADLSSATAATINSLREAMALQRMLEIDSRSGTRYPELIKAHWNVENPDSRMQRSEYLGGGSYPMIINPVTQTSESGTTKQGYLTAIGFHQQSGCGFTKSFTEHCCILGLMQVRAAQNTYQQGVHRMWYRQDREDFFFPSLAYLGEQEVYMRELYVQGNANDTTVFGYMPRWEEYRYGQNLLTGQLRSDHATPLDAWHLGIDFASQPALNSTFIQDGSPVDRIVAVTSEPQFTIDCYFDVLYTSAMPTYGIPGLCPRF